jgi:hypothetical protein
MSILPGLQFGSGYLLLQPQSSSGNPAANPTPFQIGVIQNAKFTLGADIKSLFGQNQWPVDSAIGKRSIKGSFEFAQISNFLLSQGFFSDAVTEGVVQTVPAEQHTVPSTPYEVTIAPPLSGTYEGDGGVTYAATGIPLENVGSGSLTAAGQYKVNLGTGVYTFYSGDAAAVVNIAYLFSLTTEGTTLTAGNHAMGWGPVLSLDIWFPYEDGTGGLAGIGFYFPNVRLGKIDAATKIDDYTMYTTDFEAFAGAANLPFISYQLF